MRQIACFVALVLCMLIACGDPQPHSTGTFIPGQNGSPSGAAGGDLAGSYPNPTVAQVTGATTPALTGMIRMPKNTAIKARNFNNTADVPLIGTDGSSNITIGDTTTPPSTTVLAQGTVALASNTVGNGGAEIALSSGSFANPSIEVLPDQTLDTSAILIAQSGLQFFATSTDLGSGAGVIGFGKAGTDPSGTLSTSGDMLVYARHAGDALAGYSSAGVTWGLVPVGAAATGTQLQTWLPLSGNIHTTSVSAATIWTSPSIPTTHVLSIDATVQQIDSVSVAAQSAAARIACSFVNTSGTVTQLGATTVLFQHQFGTAPSCVISGTTVLVKTTPNTTSATNSQVGGIYALD